MYKTTTNIESQNSKNLPLQAQQKGRNQNFIGIWFHDRDSPSADMHEIMMTRLKATFEYIRVYNDIQAFTTYLLHKELVASVVVIISSSIYTSSMYWLVVEQAKKEENKFRKPYVLLFEQPNTHFEQQVFTNIDNLFIAIGSDIRCYPQHLISTESEVAATPSTDETKAVNLLPPFGVMNSVVKQNSIRHLSNESLRFVQFQALMEILLGMQHTKKRAKDDMLSDCRAHYENDKTELNKIEHFKENYTARKAVFHYTECSFCFRMVNMAFRSEDIERIFLYRLFITDLHKELARKADGKRGSSKNIVVYRGKKLPNTVLQQLKDSIQKPISMNGFLSTTKSENTAKAFSGDNKTRENHASVIFELHIQNPSNYTGKPFVDISANGHEMDEEQEVLFSAGTVWRIEDVSKKDHLWYVKLTSCADFDDDLRALLAGLTDGYTLLSIGSLLEELGENDKAENFYRRMLRNEPNITNEQNGLLRFRIGKLRVKNGDFFGALDNLEQALPYFPSPTIPFEQPFSLVALKANASISNRLAIYLNIGIIHHRNNNREEAQGAWKHALKEEGLPEDLAKVNNCLGDLARTSGDYKQAKTYYEEAMKLINNSLVKEEARCEFKRRFDEFIQLSEQIDEKLKSKRQRTRSGSETTS